VNRRKAYPVNEATVKAMAAEIERLELKVEWMRAVVDAAKALDARIDWRQDDPQYLDEWPLHITLEGLRPASATPIKEERE
jgi:outer membrane murein-binding lipoprotein Lpp